MDKQVEAIRAEIRRQADNFQDTYTDMMRDAILKFIDSLPDGQPSNDLEEAAKQFVGYDMDTDNLRDYEVGIQAFIAGAQWQAEHAEDYPMNSTGKC